MGGLSRVARALTYNFRPLPAPVPLGRALAAVANFVGFDLGVGLVCRVGSSVGVGESSCVGAELGCKGARAGLGMVCATRRAGCEFVPLSGALGMGETVSN